MEGFWTPINKTKGDADEGYWTERYLQYERRHSWLRGEKPNYCENCGADMRGKENAAD